MGDINLSKIRKYDLLHVQTDSDPGAMFRDTVAIMPKATVLASVKKGGAIIWLLTTEQKMLGKSSSDNSLKQLGYPIRSLRRLKSGYLR